MKPWLLFFRNCSNGSLVDRPIPLNMSILSRASPALIGSTMPCSDEPRPPPPQPDQKCDKNRFIQIFYDIATTFTKACSEGMRGTCFYTHYTLVLLKSSTVKIISVATFASACGSASTFRLWGLVLTQRTHSLYTFAFLPPAYEVQREVMFSQVFVCWGGEALVPQSGL